MLLQALHVEIEMKNLGLRVTLLMQKGMGTPFPPHYTPGDDERQRICYQQPNSPSTALLYYTFYVWKTEFQILLNLPQQHGNPVLLILIFDSGISAFKEMSVMAIDIQKQQQHKTWVVFLMLVFDFFGLVVIRLLLRRRHGVPALAKSNADVSVVHTWREKQVVCRVTTTSLCNRRRREILSRAIIARLTLVQCVVKDVDVPRQRQALSTATQKVVNHIAFIYDAPKKENLHWIFYRSAMKQLFNHLKRFLSGKNKPWPFYDVQLVKGARCRSFLCRDCLAAVYCGIYHAVSFSPIAPRTAHVPPDLSPSAREDVARKLRSITNFTNSTICFFRNCIGLLQIAERSSFCLTSERLRCFRNFVCIFQHNLMLLLTHFRYTYVELPQDHFAVKCRLKFCLR